MDSSEKKCPYCAETIKAEAIKCRHCGTSLLTSNADGLPRKKGIGTFAKVVIGAVGLVAAFLIFGAFVANTPEGQAKTRARDVIDQCHREEKSYTGSAGAKQIITGACKKLENDFRTEFGHAP